MNIKSDFFTNLLKCCSPPPPFPNISIYFTVFQTVYKTIPLSLSLSFSVALILSPSSSSLIRNDSLSLSRFELNGFFCVLGGIQDNVSLSLSFYVECFLCFRRYTRWRLQSKSQTTWVRRKKWQRNYSQKWTLMVTVRFPGKNFMTELWKIR